MFIKNTVSYIAAALLTALARPGPPTGIYYANINPQGTVCVEVTWVPDPDKDVRLEVRCGARSKVSRDLTVDEGPPFVYKIDTHSEPVHSSFRQAANAVCLELATMQAHDLYKFVYNRDSNTIVTAFQAQGVELRPGHC
ncbi:hypothetical protein FOZ61_004039 [Perkinsus olseni]|uniref:Uncharacterized protein n=1 Tax=Perkinsus olseni TaxID=32597 RepID=A0A7J6LSA0_PEROL|nr:hypothetical protein FOZ61_004039 [Perkinsus olseni]KAF4662084.1 hypothetical protein FOL46_005483 [Perkinsus olseni]